MNLMNIMVALIVTGATMSATIPNIIASKDKAIAQNISNYEIQINNTVEEFSFEFPKTPIFNETGFTTEFKDYAFKGKAPVFPNVEGTNKIEANKTTTINNGGWNITGFAIGTESNKLVVFTPDFELNSKTKVEYDKIKPVISIFE